LSTAIGVNSKASGDNSLSFGSLTEATNKYSVAVGLGTKADGISQTVIGRYNKTDSTNYAFIIGNGTNTSTSDRSNAMTVGWNGNVTATSFTGSLNGNASSATKAMQDGNGNNIVDTYLTKAVWKANSATSEGYVASGAN